MCTTVSGPFWASVRTDGRTEGQTKISHQYRAVYADA